MRVKWSPTRKIWSLVLPYAKILWVCNCKGSCELIANSSLNLVSSIHNFNQAPWEGCKVVVLGIYTCRLPSYNLLSQHSRQGTSSWRNYLCTGRSMGLESLADNLLGCIYMHTCHVEVSTFCTRKDILAFASTNRIFSPYLRTEYRVAIWRSLPTGTLAFHRIPGDFVCKHTQTVVLALVTFIDDGEN